LASKEIRVPDLGDFKDVAVIDVLVKQGDTIQVDTPLLTLETEKATMDVPSSEAGTVEKVHVEKGGKVSKGSLIVTLAAGADSKATESKEAAPKEAASKEPATSREPAAKAAAATAPAPAAAPKAAPSAPASVAKATAPPAAASAAPASSSAAPKPAATGTGSINEAAFAGAHASPSVRRFARELGVDLGRVKGSGLKARITDEDVKAFVKGQISGAAAAKPATPVSPAAPAGGGGLPQIQVPDFAAYGEVEVKPLNRIQRISGPRLHASWVNLPHVTQFDDADITELETLRGKLKEKAEAAGIKVTPLAFVVRACVLALQRYPLFNTSLDAAGKNLVYKKYINIGFAADTPNGLLVPVIHGADHKDIYEVARALADLSAKARTGKLGAAEMQGGTFTISSLGGIGGTAFTPIINAPEVAILGVSKSSQKPVWKDEAFVPRLILPLSLSYDHRVVDGANAARFTSYLGKVLADPHSLIEAVL
jgi:pyruvate dehydrogenase E2 component (dihydrolipoamide acetyltransferase)